MRYFVLGALLISSSSLAQDTPISPDDTPVAEDAPIEEDIRDLKPALAVPNPPSASKWPWIFGALTASGLAGGAIMLARRRTKVLSPTEQLRHSLVEARARYERGDHHGHADQTASALRVFIQATTDLPAVSMTAEELLTGLKPRLPGEVWTQVQELFTQFDTFRFAGLVEVADEAALGMPWLDRFIEALVAPEEKTEQPEQAQG